MTGVSEATDAKAQPVPSTLRLAAIWIAVFLPTIALLILLKRTRPPGLYWWSWLITSVQLAAGLWVYHRYYKEHIPLWTLHGWAWAAAAFLGLSAIWYTIGIPTFWPRGTIIMAGLELFKYLVLIGFTEEFWFHGIWLAMFHIRLVPSVIFGSLVFGLIHLAHDPVSALFSGAFGAVFAAARYRGASIIQLALAHGILNWVMGLLLPVSEFRIGHGMLLLVLPPVLCVGLSASLVFWGRRKSGSSRSSTS